MTRGATALRRVLFIGAAVVVVVLLLASTVQATGALATGDPVAAKETLVVEYTVRHGDNLWTIAEGVAPVGSDVRALVDAIRSLNDLTGSTIYSGQSLLVPSD